MKEADAVSNRTGKPAPKKSSMSVTMISMRNVAPDPPPDAMLTLIADGGWGGPGVNVAVSPGGMGGEAPPPPPPQASDIAAARIVAATDAA
jgi:hypothetical protein